MIGDLHTHSTFSDGSCRIEHLPRLAAAAGLKYLAVTDHDTDRGIQYSLYNPVVEGVQLIPATELTAFDTKRERRVHLLCYCPRVTPQLRSFFEVMAQRRNDAVAQSMDAIALRYPQFSKELARRYAQDAGVLYKTHVMRVLYDFAYTDGIYKELYHELFGSGPHSVLQKPEYESLETVLALLHQAAGVTILAHPSVYNSVELAQELLKSGRIDGVELWHPRNKPEDIATIEKIAQQYQTIVTGGTDFHGFYTTHATPLGQMTTSDEMVQRILQLATHRKGT